jgi:hypothetical protein
MRPGPWCEREPSGRLVCYSSTLTDGSAWRTCWWDQGVQPVLDGDIERISAEDLPAAMAWDTPPWKRLVRDTEPPRQQ